MFFLSSVSDLPIQPTKKKTNKQHPMVSSGGINAVPCNLSSSSTVANAASVAIHIPCNVASSPSEVSAAPSYPLVRFIWSCFQGKVVSTCFRNQSKFFRVSDVLVLLLFMPVLFILGFLCFLLFIPFFLILILLFYCNPGWYEVACKRQHPYTIPSVTELQEAGVTILRKRESVGGSWDVNFHNGTLYLPPLEVNESIKSRLTKPVARAEVSRGLEGNASEGPGGDPSWKKFTAYALFMASIVKTEKDVMALRLQEIIENKQGSEEGLADFFSHLRQGVEREEIHQNFGILLADVEKFCDSVTHNRRCRCWSLRVLPWLSQ